MIIMVGSFNKAKVNAVKNVFLDATITSVEVESGVSTQPRTDKETREGAINRAMASKDVKEDSYGIGLEGGVMQIGDQLFLCNWGALVTPSNACFTASGARIPLPNEFAKPLLNGEELGDVMQEWTTIKDIRHHQGAIGIFTNATISREEMFTHVVLLLKGQMEQQTHSGK
ncbi:DUF84 family protein [Gracilibacillus kekensis]|uniref:inosine/xanthosine triphosphatase n=1 Tax=Gracilibacillus kekensis TaxID=1027249 RepID=A0A1M7NKP7_9BACI|nr:DUF84 family protein [Gracilibacillus kekensis]SHN04476.1 inosine/xanthosine triphosphatase [Gracilibacillus kekensis]